MSETPSPAPGSGERWQSWGAWCLALAASTFAVYLGWRTWTVPTSSTEPALAAVQQPVSQPTEGDNLNLSMPSLQESGPVMAISRHASLHTIIPNRPRQDVQSYTVDTGDSVFGIAQTFGLKPESVLWANYDQLNDNPDLLSLGMELQIPPVDGVLYEWKEGDSLQSVADRFEAKPEDIVNWPGNELDLTDPQFEPDQVIMVPGGHREYRQWIVPTIPRGNAGVSSSLYGAGACSGSYDGAYGTGTFVWPAANHYLSGNDYWSGHLAIDIAAGAGAAVYAADSGVVVFAGPALGGYGNMVMIDHGNGYQTLYAHMSQVSVGCGASVSQGQYIGIAGSTGHSTGPHLHFEVRYLGGFVSPWFVLPPP
ncbi:MAG TPA: peptidoglycan DD-metalloendopeptidase family protein [Anaerolineales bacterium]|nr:peptidoglycan DD-metalloendopeptidase family protein [Anaerolineales bacterium]